MAVTRAACPDCKQRIDLKLSDGTFSEHYPLPAPGSLGPRKPCPRSHTKPQGK